MFEKLTEMFEKKNEDYGDAYKKIGPVLSLILGDVVTIRGIAQLNTLMLFGTMIGKMIRLGSLISKGGRPNFESVSDTLDDIAIYTRMIKQTIGDNHVQTREPKEPRSNINQLDEQPGKDNWPRSSSVDIG